MSDRTVRLHRMLRTTPHKLYRAFLEGDAMAKWLPPHSFTCRVQELDARVGGTFRMSFHNFGSGQSHAFGGEYLELVPGSSFATPTGSTTRTCPARWRSPSGSRP